ncbi:MAG: carbon-nitrogen hydrolase family protein [Peptococcaceae bacterium]|nr:carbon-nitrogen hydrolase family protein [Peptococcaceae bacterium]
MNRVKVALCQMKVTASKEENLDKAVEMIARARQKDAEIVVLPEMFCCPLVHKYYQKYAERVPGGETVKILSEAARREGVFLIGGSLPERVDEGAIYNTSLIFDNQGEQIGKCRKLHLFDVKLKNGFQFNESATLSAGDQITVIDTPWGKIGVLICYDLRFPELARLMALSGVKMIFAPAAFTKNTGQSHWETLFKSRALDNLVFMLGCSPARDPEAAYVVYGHSIAVNPWGKVIGELEEEEGMLIVDVQLDELDEARRSLPVWQHRREDVYYLSNLKALENLTVFSSQSVKMD